jgi:hypothetical protein
MRLGPDNFGHFIVTPKENMIAIHATMSTVQLALERAQIGLALPGVGDKVGDPS